MQAGARPLVPAMRTAQEVVVVITESLTGAAVDRWIRLVHEALEVNPARLVLDLADCPNVDADAIVHLLQVHRHMVCADGRLTLRAPVPRVRRMLRLGRVDHVLDIEPPPDKLLPGGVH